MRVTLTMATIALALSTCAPLAPAQTGHDASHAQHHDVYRHWHIPGTELSCCNAKKTVDGVTTGDCYQTRARIAPSAKPELKGAPAWWAMKDTGQWVEIPDAKIVREANPDPTGESASLCIADASMVPLCFRPPNTGF